MFNTVEKFTKNVKLLNVKMELAEVVPKIWIDPSTKVFVDPSSSPVFLEYEELIRSNQCKKINYEPVDGNDSISVYDNNSVFSQGCMSD